MKKHPILFAYSVLSVIVTCAIVTETLGLNQILNQAKASHQHLSIVMLVPIAALFSVTAYGVSATVGRRRGYVNKARDYALKHIPIVLERRLKEPDAAALNENVNTRESAERDRLKTKQEKDALAAAHNAARIVRAKERAEIDAARSSLLNGAQFGIESWPLEKRHEWESLNREIRMLEQDLSAMKAAVSKAATRAKSNAGIAKKGVSLR